MKMSVRFERSMPASTALKAESLLAALARIKPANKQGEYYLTDVAEIMRADGENVAIYQHRMLAKSQASTLVRTG